MSYFLDLFLISISFQAMQCFQAGVMCATKCKCVDCLNYVGSQALIDKRRKMKDHRGAEMAMRVADEAWKGRPQSGPHGLNPRGIKPSPAASRGGRGHPMPMPHMMQPSPSPHHRGPPPPHYMGPMMGRASSASSNGILSYGHAASDSGICTWE